MAPTIYYLCITKNLSINVFVSHNLSTISEKDCFDRINFQFVFFKGGGGVLNLCGEIV